jgi:serine phosphatase RsbU (regulator of sigma subunit)
MSHHWRQTHWDPEPVILVVDDSRLNRELLMASLSLRSGYRFLEAENGLQAVEQLMANPGVDLILLDLMMPEMNGFDFLHWRLDNPEVLAIPVIVNSSLDDMDSLSIALELDCYDYFVKPLQARELELVLPLKIRNAVHARRLIADMRRKNERMAAELALAARYQHFLLPGRIDLPGIKTAWLFKPSREVGGDYFDFFELPGGQLGLVVADVAGHGVASAMTASILKALLPSYLQGAASPARALAALNDDLLHLTPEDAFVTAFLGLYQPDAHTLTWCSAGHPPALSLPPGGPMERLDHPDFLLGVFPSGQPLVSFNDREIQLGPGHRLVLYTDGFTEALDPADNPLGLDALARLVDARRKQTAAQVITALDRRLEQHTQGRLTDDVALIVMDF